MSSFEGFLALALMIASFWLTRRLVINHFYKTGGNTTVRQILGILAPAGVSLIVVPILMIMIFDESGSKQSEPNIPTAQTKVTPKTQAGPESKVSEAAVETRPDPNNDQAVEYRLLSTDDMGFAGRSRMQFNISAPTATTFEQLAQTAIKAAKDFQRSHRQQVVYVFIGKDMEQINNGEALAIANYAVDGGGNSGDQDWYWQVEAIDPLTDIERKVLALWDIHSDKFQIEDSWKIDEEGFKRFAAKELNVERDKITLRLPVRKPYFSS